MALAESKQLGLRSQENSRRLEYRDCIRYPRPEFQYNNRSAQINVLDGEGVLVIQASGIDENGKVNGDIVAHFQSVIMGKDSRKSFKVPAGSWHLLYKNIGDKPLVTEMVNDLEEFPVDQLERVPFPAFEVVRQNGALALLPTLRVRRIERVDSGGIPDAQLYRQKSSLVQFSHL